MTVTRRILLEQAHNVRDIGGYQAVSSRVKEGVLFRSDSLHALTDGDQTTLLGYGLRAIIDLRTGLEAKRQPNVFSAVRGVSYYHVPLDIGGNPDQLESLPADLLSLYKYILDESQGGLQVVMALLADAELPALVHCTAGKDRTAVVVALLLALLGVSKQVIAEDYALTASYFKEQLTEIRQRAVEAGVPAERLVALLSAEPQTMQATLDYLDDAYGGAEAYLLDIGINRGQLASLRRRFLA